MLTPSTIDYEKIVVKEKGTLESKWGVKRYDICVSSGDAGQVAIANLALDYDPSDFISGVYTTGIHQGSKKFGGERHSLPLLLSPEIDGEREFIDMLTYISKLISHQTKRECKNCVKKYTDKDGKEKYSVWCSLIESNNGSIFTHIYDKGANKLSVDKLGSHMRVRVIIVLTVVYTEAKGFSIKASASEICVMEIFPQQYRLIPNTRQEQKSRSSAPVKHTSPSREFPSVAAQF